MPTLIDLELAEIEPVTADGQALKEVIQLLLVANKASLPVQQGVRNYLLNASRTPAFIVRPEEQEACSAPNEA